MHHLIRTTFAGLLTVSMFGCQNAQNAPRTATTAAIVRDPFDRSILPIVAPPPAVVTELDARNAKAPPRFEVTAQAAPNHFIPGEVTDNDRRVTVGKACFPVVSGFGVRSVSIHVASRSHMRPICG